MLRAQGEAVATPVARRAARPAVHGGMAGLQRAAGNRAVASAMAAGRALAVQRDIGFELESGDWRARLLGRPPTADEQASGDVAHGATPVTLPAARAAFHGGAGFQGTADEIPDARDVEFVIAHQPEDRADLVAAAFDRVSEAVARMEAAEQVQAAKPAYLWPERQLGWVPPAAGTWLLENEARAGPTQVVMQATAGLRLDRMHGLMANLGDPQVDFAEGDDPLAETSVHPGAGAELQEAAWIAGAAWDEHLRVLPPPPDTFTDDAALRGVLSQMALLIVGGTRAPDAREEASVSYPKALAHLMSRTDFAAQFRLLPDRQQAALRAGRLLDAVERIATRTDVPGLDERVLQPNVWRQIERTQILLTRRSWVEGILANQDRLTEAGYGAWLDDQVSRPRGMHAAVYDRAMRGARHLDSLGSRGAAVDRRDGRALPLYEFRALAGDDGARSMTLAQAKARALRLAAYVDRVNRGQAPLPT